MAGVKLLLVGSPNAGKSTLFNLLTGGHAKVGNWHGVTVGVLGERTDLGGTPAEIFDLPGIYSVKSMSPEETLARDYVLGQRDGLILFVAECTGLERVLPLFFSLAEGRRAALVLTKRRAFVRAGGAVDGEELSRRLGVPVLFSEGKRRRAFSEELARALPAFSPPKRGAVLEHIYRPAKTGMSRADRLFTNGLFVVPLFLALLALASALAFAPNFPGDLAKGAVERFFTEFLYEACEPVSSPVLKSLLQRGILTGLGSVLSLLPQIAVLYLCLILMEESGLLSRLAMLTDGFFSHIGLNGRAVFSLLMGFGCTAAAVLTTRGSDDRAMQRRTILCLPYLPCSAKLPVFLALASSISDRPFLTVMGLYALGIVLCIAAARLLRPRVREPFLVELDPLQAPRPIFVFKSLLFQLKQFIIKTATVILAFFLFSWLLSSFDVSLRLCPVEKSMLAGLCGWLKWLFAPVGMNDWRIAYAALSGLVAKENVAGAIAMLYGKFPYGGASAFAFAVFLLTCSPCVSAIAATAREVGRRRAALYALIQTASALLFSYAVYFMAKGGAVVTALALSPVIAFLILGRHPIANIRRIRTLHVERVHRPHGRAGVLRLSHPSEGEGDPRERKKDGGGRHAPRGRRRRLLHDRGAGEEKGVHGPL